jgi:hypothetical protein
MVGQMMAEIKAVLKAGHEEIKAHQERVMAITKASLEEMKSVAEHQDVPKEEATEETIEALVDRHLAVGCHQQPKKRTQGDCGSQKLALRREQYGIWSRFYAMTAK